MELPEEFNGAQVVEIHPDAKYVLCAKRTLGNSELELLQSILRKWWEGREKFLVIGPELTLVRVDEVESGLSL